MMISMKSKQVQVLDVFVVVVEAVVGQLFVLATVEVVQAVAVGQAIDPEPELASMDQDKFSDDIGLLTAAEFADELLPTYFDELEVACAGIMKYEALVLKGHTQVKTKAYNNRANAGLQKYQTQFAAARALINERRKETRSQALEAAKKGKKPIKGPGKHAADFSDRECLRFHSSTLFFLACLPVLYLWHALPTLHLSTFLFSGTPCLFSTLGTPCQRYNFPTFFLWHTLPILYPWHTLPTLHLSNFISSGTPCRVSTPLARLPVPIPIWHACLYCPRYSLSLLLARLPTPSFSLPIWHTCPFPSQSGTLACTPLHDLFYLWHACLFFTLGTLAPTLYPFISLARLPVIYLWHACLYSLRHYFHYPMARLPIQSLTTPSDITGPSDKTGLWPDY
jgi:hypothetical protein